MRALPGAELDEATDSSDTEEVIEPTRPCSPPPPPPPPPPCELRDCERACGCAGVAPAALRRSDGGLGASGGDGSRLLVTADGRPCGFGSSSEGGGRGCQAAPGGSGRNGGELSGSPGGACGGDRCGLRAAAEAEAEAAAAAAAVAAVIG